jgi:hypothetical protein
MKWKILAVTQYLMTVYAHLFFSAIMDGCSSFVSGGGVGGPGYIRKMEVAVELSETSGMG